MIASLRRWACLLARQPTCLTHVTDPVIQIRGAKGRHPQKLQIKEENAEDMTEEERAEAMEKQRIYSQSPNKHLLPYETRWTNFWADINDYDAEHLEDRVRNFTANWKLAMYDSSPGDNVSQIQRLVRDIAASKDKDMRAAKLFSKRRTTMTKIATLFRASAFC
ncbi:hypothetical protein BDZ89DRAFT_1137391 [Hymenopellis radicata]|nr:hypothetical protein BDZ89DRAFT_1137391 [Hymenopellis radicata]